MAESSQFPLTDLAAWLRDPVITVRLSNAEEVEQLRAKVQVLEREYSRVLGLYTQECDMNMRLVDILRDAGIRWR